MIKRVIGNRFFQASFWMFFMTGFVNVGSYAYHLLTGKFLGPALYGILESSISLLYIVSVPLVTMTFVVIKFVSVYQGRNDRKSLGGLYHYIQHIIIRYGLLFTGLLIITAPLTINFLHLPSYSITVLIALSFFIGFLLTLTRGMLQGMSKFSQLAFTNIAEVVIKIVCIGVLIYIGLRSVEYALLAVVLGSLVAYGGSLYFLQKEKLEKHPFKDQKQLLLFAIPVFFITLATTSLYTTDVLLVRSFFPDVTSGHYAALSILGKIIFFATSPIIYVMFPLVSEHHAKGTKYIHFLFLSILFTGGSLSIIISIYYLFPELMISLLFGKDYLAIAPLLGLFSIFMGLYTLCNVLANFYLSIHKIIPVYFVIIAAVLQIVGISVFHTSLLQVIYVSIAILLLLLISLVLYYPYATRLPQRK